MNVETPNAPTSPPSTAALPPSAETVQPPATAPAAAVQDQKPRRRAVDPDRRKREAADAKLRRALKAAKKNKSAAELLALAEKISGDEPPAEITPTLPTEASEPAAEPEKTPPPATETATPPDAAKPTKPIATDLHLATVQTLVGVLGGMLEGTRYSITGVALVPKLGKGGELELEQKGKADLLVEAGVPVLAKYWAGGELSPEAALVMACAFVWGAPAISDAKALLKRKPKAAA